MTPENAAKLLLTGRVIVGALTLGIIGFATIAAIIVLIGAAPTDESLAVPLLIALGAFALTEAPAYLVIRQVLINQVRNRYADAPEIDPTELLPHFQTLTIVGAAMAEGFGLFGTVVTLATGQWIALAAPAVALIALGLIFPTYIRFANYVSTVINRPWP